MTGSLFTALPLSSPAPVRPVAPNCAVDSFSEFSPRTVNCASFSPTSAASGPRSVRPKEEDEELFRDLFARENGAAAGEEPSTGGKLAWSAAPTFIPQKPVMQRAPSSTGSSIPRQHLAPMKPAPPQPVLSAPFIPRLKLEELVNARPDDDDDDDVDDNNDSVRTSRPSSELEQVMEEDESYFDDGPSEGGDSKAAPRNAQASTCHRGFYSSLGFANNNQRPSNNDSLDQETLRFLERLDLKALLHTPRPDLLSFYPSMAPTPTPRSMTTSPHAKVPGVPAKPAEDFPVEKPEKDQIGMSTEKGGWLHGEPLKVPRVDGVASRLAYMESTYGTAPIVRKTRRETIDRLANPFSGHTSTLQALSPKQREKREAACTSRVPFSPISAAIAVSCSRDITTKKAKTPATLLGGVSKRIGDRDIPAAAKRKATKRQDTLVHKRRSSGSTIPHVGGQGPTVNGLTKRKSKTTLGSRSLVTRKEALKKKLRSRSGSTKLGGGRQIGGSTFLTQRDDEDGVELIEDFLARNRGATQATLTFRSSTKAPPHHDIPALPTRNPSTSRSRPRPPQMHTGASFARVSGASKNTHRGRAWEGPTVVCRDCRAQLSVEESEEHDCSTAAPSPTKLMFLKTAAKASSFMDAVLDKVPVKKMAEENAPAGKLDQAPPPHHLDRANPTSQLPEVAEKQQQASVLQRSASETRAPSVPSVKSLSINEPRRWTAVGSPAVHSALLQCNVRDVRVAPNRVAVYSLATRVPSLAASEITVERRFREFYVFALHVCAMFPSSGLWKLLPPKTYCALRHHSTLTDGFLHRRRSGLEEFLHCALEKMVLGGEAQGTIAQWYLLRLFLNLPPAPAAAAPSKDRSLTAALYELKKHARQYSGWTVNRKPGPCDTVFEKVADSFPMVKRVATCHFPARAVFDMVMNRSVDDEMPGNGAGVLWAPFVESEEVLSRENEHEWTVRTVFKGSSWGRGKLQMISRKTWRVDESGTIAIVMIPADAAAWDDPRVVGSSDDPRVDCIVGGWLITPTPWEGSCSVTWLMQVNFGQCDPRAEFTGNQSLLTSFQDRRCLHAWADEIDHLVKTLEGMYDAELYRNVGPLTTGGKRGAAKSSR
ncbi:hypothetical protein PHYPSEUDO_012824 [Phytophthora pseudosyringae]|uniref:PX domain-containing protein n=1 Tax=Phytophthora pseudosyringae TaxID=221518 RepID=A0A8T1W6H8_9STRA|nr:hypothetical protein PHYPSEUDO_012824 [Phytophthora pseudosyringae]